MLASTGLRELLEKNDCERNAAKRFITKLRQDHPHLKVIVTEDSLSANAPHIQLLHDHNVHYILGVKEGDHACLFEQVAAAEHAGRVTYYDRDDPETGLRHRFGFVSDVPLNASHADLRVNFLECWEWDKDKVQYFSWVTDLRVNKGTVYQIMRGGRARWRIESVPQAHRVVVSVGVKAPRTYLGQVGIRETNTREPLLTRRKPQNCRQNQGRFDLLGWSLSGDCLTP